MNQNCYLQRERETWVHILFAQTCAWYVMLIGVLSIMAIGFPTKFEAMFPSSYSIYIRLTVSIFGPLILLVFFIWLYVHRKD